MSVSRDPAKQHPIMRVLSARLMELVVKEGLPHRPYERFRSPRRQAELYCRGRVRDASGMGGAIGNSAKIVTRAQPWESRHQFGLAEDWVPLVDGNWRWDADRKLWKRFHELAHEVGLDTLPSEAPHVQVRGLVTKQLRLGRYPMGGDGLWRDSMRVEIADWPASGLVLCGIRFDGQAPPPP